MGFITLPTLAQTFLKRCEETPSAILYRTFSKNPALHGSSVTFHDFFLQTQNFSLGLKRMGAQPGDSFAILAQSRPEWMLADLAVQGVNGVSISIDPELSKKDVLEILKDSKPRFLFSDQNQHVSLFLEWLNIIPSLEKIIFFDSHSMAGLARDLLLQKTQNLMSMLAIEELGRRESDRTQFEITLKSIQPDAPYTVCYTSGTTGHPKRNTISQGALAFVTHACIGRLGSSIKAESEVTFCILPYAHIFGRVEAYTPFVCGWTECFTDSRLHFLEHFVEAGPSVVFSVPQVLEKFALAAKQRMQQLSTAKSLILKTAKLTGYSGRFLGLGKNLKLMIVGGSSLDPSTKVFFQENSIRVIEGYGLTETAGPIALEDPNETGLGQVGLPLPGVEVQLTEENEIRVRSPSLSKNIQLTDEWYYTGDLGKIDPTGHLRITGRKKDLLILSTGRRLSPVKIENQLQALAWIENAIVVGDGRPQLVALFTLKKDRIEEIALEHKILSSTYEDLCRQPVIVAMVKKAVQTVNDENAAFERIAHFSIVPRSFSQELGEVTPTLKLKRQVIIKNQQALINAMYQP